MSVDAIILAGGKGTRLKSVVSDVPKPMALVNKRPFISYILDQLIDFGVEDAYLSVGYRHDVIMSYFGNRYKTIRLHYVVEDEPLGTGGGIRLACETAISDDVLILNGDTFFNSDIQSLISTHKNSDATMTIALKQMDQVNRYGMVELSNSVISAFTEKTEELKDGLINAGMYVLNRKQFLNSTESGVFSMEKDYMEKRVTDGVVFGKELEGYFIDIGIPNDYHLANGYFLFNGLNINKSWTLFLDRDGVINKRLIDDYVKNLQEFEWLENVPQTIVRFSEIFGRVLVVTNQQGIGKGLMTESDLQEVHDFINDEVTSRGGRIDKFYHCPDLKTKVNHCRKPNPAMGLQAKEDFPEIDFRKSVMVGDSVSDMEFGRALGMYNLFISPKSDEFDAKLTDFVTTNLSDFTSILQ